MKTPLDKEPKYRARTPLCVSVHPRCLYGCLSKPFKRLFLGNVPTSSSVVCSDKRFRHAKTFDMQEGFLHPVGVLKSSRGVGANKLERSGSDLRRPPEARYKFMSTLKGCYKTMLLCGCMAIIAAAQVRINYHDQDFTLSGFDNFSATLENEGIGFKGTGNPLKIKIQSSGTTISGANAEGNAQRGPTRAYYLQNATITGNADLTIDGAQAQKFAADQAKAAGKTASMPPETTTTDIKSDTLKYSGTVNDGRVDFPGPVTIDSDSKGQSTGKNNATTSFQRTLHVTGSSGFVTMALNVPGNNALKTGEIAGPVTYSGKSDTTSSGQTQTTTFEGKADNLKFDFTATPKTMTLTGNVTLTAKGAAASGDIAADTVVVTLDANLKPTKIDITGSPAKTTLHQEPKP